MELETICRYDLPVCTIVFNNNGVYRGTDVNPTVFVKGARYDKMIEAFGGHHATMPEELTKALQEAIAFGKPTLINAVIDEATGTESGRHESEPAKHGNEKVIRLEGIGGNANTRRRCHRLEHQ